jgi:putative transcriptional regulator
MKNRLRVFRAEHHLSQADLAERLGVARQTVHAIETGKFAPSLTLAFKISTLFGANINDVFAPDAEDTLPSLLGDTVATAAIAAPARPLVFFGKEPAVTPT